MGLCTSGLSEEEARAAREANVRNKKIEEDIRKDQQTDVRVFKLLLLGAGESGKSTLFKQMLCIYGEGFTQDQLNQYLPSIHQLVFSSMKTLTYQALERNLPFGDDSKAAVNYFRDLSDEEALLDADSAKFVKALWKEKSIREVYEHRAQFYLVDSCAYFFDNVDRIAHPSYSPNYEDVLKCRVRTTGIVESKFTIAAHQFMLVDVGGQRNERKKWIHCFEGVTAVIFVAAISEYDQMLFEDASVSRTIEALNLFDEVLNLKWFSQKPVLLFLNKRDLFAEKIKTNPLSKHWPDYNGDGSYESSVDYMRNKYLERVPAERKSQVYAHVVCATDQENVAHVFNDVKDIIIRRALQGSGLDFGN